MTKGECFDCRGETSTIRTKRCKKCYDIYLLATCKEKTRVRDKIIIEDIASGLRAAGAARKHGLTRQGISCVMKRHGLNYWKLLYSGKVGF